MLLLVKYPVDLVKAIDACRKGELRTPKGLRKGASGQFVVVEQDKSKDSRFAKFAALGNEVLNIFEGDKPFGVVINNAVFKYMTVADVPAKANNTQNTSQVKATRQPIYQDEPFAVKGDVYE